MTNLDSPASSLTVSVKSFVSGLSKLTTTGTALHGDQNTLAHGMRAAGFIARRKEVNDVLRDAKAASRSRRETTCRYSHGHRGSPRSPDSGPPRLRPPAQRARSAPPWLARAVVSFSGFPLVRVAVQLARSRPDPEHWLERRFVSAQRRSVAVVAEPAIACQSSVFRRHLNEATKLGRAAICSSRQRAP
jgi:hypothetical protein